MMEPASVNGFSTSTTADGASTSKVLVEKHTPFVTEWKLNAPKVLNSVDTEMCNLMIDELKKWHAERDHPRALLMSGMGGKAFCAGGDIVSLYKAHTTPGADKSILASFFAREYLLDYSLSQMR